MSIEVTVHISRNLYDNNQKYDQIYRAVEMILTRYNKTKPDYIPFFSLSSFSANDILNIGVSGDMSQLETAKKDFLELIIELKLKGSVKDGVVGKQLFWS